MREEKKETERNKMKIPLIMLTRTSGLTNTLQLVDFTSNEVFSFQDTTSATTPPMLSTPLPITREIKTTSKRKTSKKKR